MISKSNYTIGFIKKITGKDFDELITKVTKHFDDVFNEVRNLSLVSCFSLKNDDILMWSHYADSHKGACIKYEIEDKNFAEVKYSKSMPDFQLVKALEISLGHSYAGKEIDVNNKDYFFMIDPLLTKSDEWIYEKEVRCIFSKNKPDPRIKKEVDKKGKETFLLKMPKPIAIYIGCNATKKFIGTIKKLKGDIPLFVMKPNDNEYSLIAEPLD